MKLYRASGLVLLLLSAALVAGCDDDDTTGLTLSAFAGAWTATNFSYTDASNSALTLDIIAHLGGALTLDVQQSGSFTGNLTIPNLTPTTGLPIGGTLSLNAAADSVTVVWNATTASYMTAGSENCEGGRLLNDFTASFSFNAAQTVLTITETDATFDFPDQIETTPRCSVPAIAVVRLEKD